MNWSNDLMCLRLVIVEEECSVFFFFNFGVTRLLQENWGREVKCNNE